MDEVGTSPASSASWQGYTVRNGVERLAVCNNGEPASWYLQAGSGSGADKWIVFLKGGGGCHSVEECNTRWEDQTHLMRPRNLGRDPDSEGLMSPSQAHNPDFHNWNKVHMAYCSSDQWTGDSGANDRNGGYHFRGSRIVDAVFEDLQTPKNTGRRDIDDASEIIFWGGSAGANGMKQHVDSVTERFPKARVVGLNDSAFTTVVVPAMEEVMRKGRQEMIEMMNPQVDDSCLAAEKDVMACLDWTYVLKNHVSTPTFVFMDQFDSNSLKLQGISGRDSTHALAFKADVRENLEQFDGCYSSVAGVHVLATKDNFYEMDIRKEPGRDAPQYTMQEVFGNWYFDRKGPKRVIAP